MITNREYVEKLRTLVWEEVFAIADGEPDLDGYTAGKLAESAARAFEQALTATLECTDQELDEHAAYDQWQTRVDAWLAGRGALPE
jgi:hypothetical protein